MRFIFGSYIIEWTLKGKIMKQLISTVSFYGIEGPYLEDMTCGFQFRLLFFFCRDAVLHTGFGSRLGKVFIQLNLQTEGKLCCFTDIKTLTGQSYCAEKQNITILPITDSEYQNFTTVHHNN